MTDRLVGVRRWLGLQVPLPAVRMEIGAGWLVHLPRRAYLADGPGRGRHSPLVVWEDERPLPMPHADHEAVRREGAGRFCHVGEWLLFSTSDGTDPTTNGRRYRMSTAWWLYRRAYGRMPFQRGVATASSAPVNFQPRDARPEAIARDADYAVRTGRQFLEQLEAAGLWSPGATVLELGPGHHLGMALFLAGAGFEVAVADPFLLQFDPGYHGPVYRAIVDRARAADPEWDAGPVDRVLAAADHAPTVRCVPAGAEHLAGIADASFDAVVSMAVLEHVRDPIAAAREAFRVTRPGGVGLHQVDHRDHRDFARPLEYLLVSDAAFQELFDHLFGECGNRLRRRELSQLFRAAGFEVDIEDVNLHADPAYLRSIQRRLRNARDSSYRDSAAEDLAELSCWYVLRKP